LSSTTSHAGADAALESDYERAGFAGHLAFGRKPALLIVDVVQAYLEPSSPLYAPPFEDALRSNERLVAVAREVGVPVIFTGVRYAANGVDGGLFFRKVQALRSFLPDSRLGAFPPTLQPLADELVVIKQYASAFFGSSLAATLTSLGIDTLLITGFSTSGCVRATTLDALQSGFVPYVVREACGDRDPRPHESNLFDLQAKYAEVVGEGRAIELMRAVKAGAA